VEIELNKQTEKPLYKEDQYLYDVYLFADSYITPLWDYLKGENNGTLVGGEGFYIGTDGKTLVPAIKRLKDLEILSKESDFINNIMGFSYIGYDFPTKIRFYISNMKMVENLRKEVDTAPNPQNSYLVYSHHEVKWGKDLSWVKIVPIN